MTHDELLASIERMTNHDAIFMKDALLAVIELHKPIYDNSCLDLDCCRGPYPDLCDGCKDDYPCKTIQAIEKELG